jgi:hypothetical protein
VKAPTQDYAPGTFPEVYTTEEVNGLIAGLRTEFSTLGPRLSTELTTKLNKDLDEFNVRVLAALSQGKPVTYLRSEAQIKQIQEEVRREVQAQYSKRLTDLETRVAALEKRPR